MQLPMYFKMRAVAMPSPFPGMDPFLEVSPRWEAFHAWFMRKLAEQALPKAQELGCWIDVERTVYQREPSGEIVLVGEPDQSVGVDVSSPAWDQSPSAPGAIALAEPKAIHEVVLDPATLERIKQDYLVVRELGQFPRVLAVVEGLIQENKTGKYAPRYREKRMKFLTSRAHFMEIDLLRGGSNPSRQLFHELPAMPYFTVSPVTTSGVSAAKVVATIDVPASHHGMARPERKNSSDEEPARRE